MSLRRVADGKLITETTTRHRQVEKPAAHQTPPRAPDEPSPFGKLLRSLGREVDKGEGVVNKAVAGKNLDNGDLLALQVGVYRYSEAVDLAAKLVDRASNGVKTVLQGQ